MTRLIAVLLLLSSAGPLLAVDRIDLDYRISKLGVKLDSIQAKPDKRIPAHVLRKAEGIVMLDRTKAGFLFAYQGGNGVAFVRDGKSRKWGPPAFLKANEASLGFQIGGQQSFIVILLMNTNAIRMLTQGSFKFGGEASGTAGNESAGAEGSISSSEPPVLVYNDREGLYGGATIRGDAISPDAEANLAYYGQNLSTAEILSEHKVKPGQSAVELVDKIDQQSK